jgi:hypothetical protein
VIISPGQTTTELVYRMNPRSLSKHLKVLHICGFLINDGLSADDQPIREHSNIVYFGTREFARAEDAETLSNDTGLAAWVFPHERTTDLACPLKSVKLRKVAPELGHWTNHPHFSTTIREGGNHAREIRAIYCFPQLEQHVRLDSKQRLALQPPHNYTLSTSPFFYLLF